VWTARIVEREKFGRPLTVGGNLCEGGGGEAARFLNAAEAEQFRKQTDHVSRFWRGAAGVHFMTCRNGARLTTAAQEYQTPAGISDAESD
jgi:hypothetical protein